MSAPAPDAGPWATVAVLYPSREWPGQRDNFVRTTRYTLLTFVPLTLWENFRLATNIYFLIILVISWLPWSPISYAFNFYPLIFVLLVSMVKSGIEDLLKYAEDKLRNSSPIKVYRHGEWIGCVSRDVQAGDLVLQEGDAMVACDMLYVTSSRANQTANYTEAQLNGESAVKTIVPHRAFKGKEFPEHLLATEYRVQMPEPTRDLYRFDAKLICGADTWPITIQNVLLRGMNICYTDWVIGVAVATGHDTKSMKNMRHPPAKRTEFDRDINMMIIGVFVFKMIVITSFSVYAGFCENNGTFPWVGMVASSTGESILIAWMQYFVLYSYLIPISLMVTIEIIRLFHMFLIVWDRLLVDEEFGSASPHNSNQIGQLGRITHVLTDKTGTLTENVMELVGFADASGVHRPDDASYSETFLMCLAICNTVVVYHSPTGATVYNAESPDEAAFVSFAANWGIRLVDRQPDSFALEIAGELHHYRIVSLIPFTSERKRMTIVVEEGDSCVVYSKGADSVMFPIVVEPMFGEQITEYATAGLRTLVFARKELDSGEAESWRVQWHEAATLLVGRDEAIAQIAPQVESQLECIGASAVEDKLQPYVPEAINWLRKAGIRVWVLTGDKLETAVEIGRTSAVISAGSEMLIISQETDEAIINQFQKYRHNMDAAMRDPVLILTARASEMALDSQQETFLELANRCQTVIFSRVSPFQKASIVALVKDQPGALVLAIGDGANDVGMLQEAHVGIGVKGREGSQAAQASDFAIPRFRHLIPLLGVDGHWASVRLTGVTLFMLYKNFAMICVYIWSSVDTMGSPTDFYDQFLISFFNLLFTLLPPFAYGFFERDSRKCDLLAYPQLYSSGFNPMKLPWLVGYFALGLWQSIAVYYIVRLAMPDGALQSNGNLAYVCIVTIIAVQFLLWSYDWNWIMILACALTVVLLFSILIAYAYTMVQSLIGMVEQTLGSIKGWAVFFACVVAGNMPYLAMRAFIEKGWPSLQRLVREREGLDHWDGQTLEFWELMKKVPGGGAPYDGARLDDIE